MVMRIFIGCAPNHEDAESQAVLEYTIAKHTTEPFEIEWMKLSRDPLSFWSGWQTSQWATPFSGFRWAIPEFCKFDGRAIYMDSDMIVMDDLAKLWRQPIPDGKVVLAKGGGSWRYCVSLWDCKAAGQFVEPIRMLRASPQSHRRMVAFYHSRPDLTAPFSGDWNCLDGEGHADLYDGRIGVIHYTNMQCQPQLKYALPRLKAVGRKHWFNGTVTQHPRADLIALFDKLLAEAAASGYGVERYCQDPLFGEIAKKSLVNYRGAPA